MLGDNPRLAAMQHVTLIQLSYFVATANLNSLSEAARHLNVSQPSISTAIRHIEEALGYPLFTRHNRFGVRLTAEGREVFDQARQVLSLIEDLGSQKTGNEQDLVGQVSIGCFDPLASFHLPALMRSLAAAFPRLTIRYDVRRQPALHEAVLSGDLNLAITYDTGVWEDVVSLPIGHVNPFLITSAQHRFAAWPSVSLSDIVDEKYILIDWAESKQYQLGLFTNTGRMPNVVAYAPTLELLRGMVANGLGVSISVTRPVGDISYDGLPIRCIPISDPIPPQRIVICHSRDRHLTRASLAVMDHIMQNFRPRK